MKINVDQNSPHFWRHHFSTSPHIFVDGVEVSKCTEADEDAGYVERLATDDDGRIIAENGCAKIERLHGVVSIVPDAN